MSTDVAWIIARCRKRGEPGDTRARETTGKEDATENDTRKKKKEETSARERSANGRNEAKRK